MLVHRLDFAAHDCDEGKVRISFERGGQLPAPSVGKLRSPQFFDYCGVRRARSGVIRQNETFERQRHRSQGLGQLKGKRTAGKHFAGGVAGGCGVRGSEEQFNFVQGSLGIPKCGGAAWASFAVR